MTVQKLFSELAVFIAEGHGRQGVFIDKSTFTGASDDDDVVLQVATAEMKRYLVGDGNGGLEHDSKGDEVRELVLVLKGE